MQIIPGQALIEPGGISLEGALLGERWAACACKFGLAH